MRSLNSWFLILTATAILVKTEYSCFSSSSSEAKSIKTVYDEGQDVGDFWYGENSQLVPCNFSSIYSSSSSSKCFVCLNDSVRPETVLLVLCNLTSSVKLVFEGPRGQINFSKTDCPRPKPIRTTRPGPTEPGASKPGTNDPNHERDRIGLYCFAFLCALIIIIIIIICLACKLCNSHPTSVNESI